MDKKQLVDNEDFKMVRPKKDHTLKVLLIGASVFIVCAGIAGYFIGGAMKQCYGQEGVASGNLGGANWNDPEWSQKNDASTNDLGGAFMTIGNEARVGDCVCSTVDGVVLLKEADLYSDVVGILERDQCFRLVRSLEWQTDGRIFYRLLNTKHNQTGWALSSHFRRRPSNVCTAPLITDADVDVTAEFATGPVSQQCLGCICQLESGCQPLGCRMDVGSLSCGYFQIKNSYWADCGKPGKDLLSCGKDIYCSSMCVQKYMARYVPGSGCTASCQTYAREHNGGPRGCKSSSTIGYWNRLIRQRGCANPPLAYGDY